MPQKVVRVLQVGMSTNYGGTEAVVYEIYRHIDRTKIQFDFLNVYDEPLAKQEWLESLGARIYSLKLKRREGYLKYLKGIKTFYRNHSQEIDVVVCNVQCLDQIAMAKYAKKFGIKKTLIHLHNANYGIQPSKLARIAIAWNKRNCHKYVDQLLACSSLAAKWGYSKRDYPKCKALMQGIDVQRMRFSFEKREAFRERYGFSGKTKLFVSVGRMDPQKNHVFLIQIFSAIAKRCPNARFVLVGDGPLAAETLKQINTSVIRDRFLVIPRMSDVEVLYAGADVFLLPSRFEGLGMVLIEAQCSGLPCLATKSTIPEEVKINESFRFLDLAEGPERWANEAIEVKEQNRDEAYRNVVAAGRDIMDTVREYSQLIL